MLITTICDNQVRVTTQTTRAVEIYKFPITSFRGFTFPADNEFINSHPTLVFLTRTNVFNRYSCLYGKRNCSQRPVCQTKIYISCKSKFVYKASKCPRSFWQVSYGWMKKSITREFFLREYTEKGENRGQWRLRF